MNYGKYVIAAENGFLKELLDTTDASSTNFIDSTGCTGSIAYTYLDDDITAMQSDDTCPPYSSRMNTYTDIEETSDGWICIDLEHAITTTYTVDEAGLVIESRCSDPRISQFALNLDLNFMGKKGFSYTHQLLPTSPYTSEDERYMYYLMPRPDKKFLVVAGLNEGLKWKLQYSPDGLFHYIDGLQIISDFDRQYAPSNRKHIKIRLFVADSIEEAYTRIGELYHLSYCLNVTGGGFGNAYVKVSEGVNRIVLLKPDQTTAEVPVNKERIVNIAFDQYGLYTVIPYQNEKKGLNTTLWNGIDRDKLFLKSCESIRKPYHNDHNLCEGGMFLWAMLVYMRLYDDTRFADFVKEELEIVMGENGHRVPRRSILPYRTEYAPYHVCSSVRVQEQFTGVSILTEAYKLFGEEKYLLHAMYALKELEDNWITDDGMIFSLEKDGSIRDYTTVCAPVIAVVDMAILLEEKDPPLAEHYRKLAVRIADFLVTRDLQFPTEGTIAKNKETEVEDGSVSCSALSVLYVCRYVQHKDTYLQFAKKILDLHDAWTIYTPDARMHQSSFRWWETIWEGDGEGPAICAGHAWTIWRAEALYWYGILARDDRALQNSWNGYITNLAKIDKDGCSYSCYEADYIRGGGIPEIKEKMLQLKGENHQVQYRLAHDYPRHKDNSLSRYVWSRYENTWYHTACIMETEGKLIGINADMQDGIWTLQKGVNLLYLGAMTAPWVLTIKAETKPELISQSTCEISGTNGRYMIRKD